MSENAEAKGRRYLIDGRLVVERVDMDAIVASCRGAGQVWRLGWTATRGWCCTCPARGTCSHLHALQAVTVATETRKASS